jgi:DNA invertase Pin-like site-specific DNA recombinase
MATVLYARVSTAEQTIEHQEGSARAAGFKIDTVVSDNGVSGISTRLRERKEGRRLYDMLRAGDVLVVRWVDRLGRNYIDVSDTIREFMRRGVVIKTIINGMTFDGAETDPLKQAVRDALIAFMAALSQAQAEATKDAMKAGIAHARQTNPKAYLGRKQSYTRAQLETVTDALDKGEENISRLAKEVGLSRTVVFRIRADRAAAELVLRNWEPQ